MRKLFILAIFLAIGILEFLIYLDFRLYYRAEKVSSIENRIKVLEKANKFFPMNDLVFYELGKAYYDLGLANLDDKENSEAYLKNSSQNFKKSLEINPASYFSHFYFAQTLLYLDIVSPQSDGNAFDELKKAAQLAGENQQILFETGKLLLSHWPQLSEEDKKFTIETVGKMELGTNEQQFRTIMEIWAENVKDYAIMEKALPEEPDVYLRYASFLGAKSLSLEQRQKAIAKADLMEFEKAQRNYNLGEKAYDNFRMSRASQYFTSCLDYLERIKFYQRFTQENLISLSEFQEKYKSTLLNLGMSLIDQGEQLKDVESYLLRYLGIEKTIGEVQNLESYLAKRGLITENLEDARNDLDLFSFQLYLYFKGSRYKDIMKAEQFFRQNLVFIPEQKKERYTEILQYFGDAYQKEYRFYEAEELYQKALETSPDNLKILLRIKDNYQKMNDNEKILKVNEKIEKLLSPKERVLEDQVIRNGEEYSYMLTLDGRRINLDLVFQKRGRETSPLITVIFNDQVVWENYLQTDLLSIPLETNIGENVLIIRPLNQSILIKKINYRSEGESS